MHGLPVLNARVTCLTCKSSSCAHNLLVLCLGMSSYVHGLCMQLGGCVHVCAHCGVRLLLLAHSRASLHGQNFCMCGCFSLHMCVYAHVGKGTHMCGYFGQKDLGPISYQAKGQSFISLGNSSSLQVLSWASSSFFVLVLDLQTWLYLYWIFLLATFEPPRLSLS